MKSIIKRISKRARYLPRAVFSIGLALILAFSAAGCSSKAEKVTPVFPTGGEAVLPTEEAVLPTEEATVFPTEEATVTPSPDNGNEIDTRASVVQTFNAAAMISIQNQSEPITPENALPLVPGDTIMNLGEFLNAFAESSAVFQMRLLCALTQAGLQTDAENEVIRLDALGNADIFSILTTWEDGPDATLAHWESYIGGEEWSLETNVKDYSFYLLFSEAGVEAAEFSGTWYEADQYLYCSFCTVNYRLEIDILRTDYGFVCQLYEPGVPAVYRLSFEDGESWNSGIGYTFDLHEQPDVILDPVDHNYAKNWPELGNYGNAVYIMVEGENLTVGQNGKKDSYKIIADDAQLSEEITPVPPEKQSELSAEAAPYARMWHASQVLGSGWNERFALYPDGSFIWGASQMDGESTIRFLAGTWDVKDGQLYLNSELIIGWEGGELVENTGIASYASANVLLDPETIIYQVEYPLVLSVSAITTDNERGLDTVTFQNLQCWDYSGQEEGAMDDFWYNFPSTDGGAGFPKDKKLSDSAFE